MHLCRKAILIEVEGYGMVTALEDGDGSSVGLYQGEELYCLISKEDNEKLTTVGCSVSVNLHTGTEELYFLRHWVVADDWELSKI